MLYTTDILNQQHSSSLFYQDFKDTFVCYTQRNYLNKVRFICCFIRILKILLYAIHNPCR